MKIEYQNMPIRGSKLAFTLRYLFNIMRTWLLFHLKYRWVKYHGFVRVLSGTTFARGFRVTLGHNVQFGPDCKIVTDIRIGNHVLCAGRVCFVGKYDHTFQTPCQTIWQAPRGDNGLTVVSDDVWLGQGVTVVGPVTIGAGSVVAAGAVVTRDIPPCEVWGGVPAKKLADRFKTDEEKRKHLAYLDSIFQK